MAPELARATVKFKALLERYGVTDDHRAKALNAIEKALEAEDTETQLNGVNMLLKLEGKGLEEGAEMFKREQLANGRPTEIVLTGAEFMREINLTRERLRKAITGTTTDVKESK